MATYHDSTPNSSSRTNSTPALFATASTTAQSIVVTETPLTTVAAPTVAYRVVRTWSIPNGGQGKLIIIPAELSGEAGMARVGDKLRTDTRNDRNAVVNIFTDERAAALYGNLNMSDDDYDFYVSHFVGQYVRNASTGYHALDIYLDGFGGTNVKTIKY